MPKTKIRTPSKSAVFEYFTITTDNKHFVCQCIKDDDDVDGEILCEAKISSFTTEHADGNAPTRASNLKRHLKRHHPKIMEIVTEKDNQAKTKIIPSISPSTSQLGQAKDKSKEVQAPLKKYFITDKITVTMTTEKFKQHIIELVVNNSLSLSLFSQPAFLGLNGEMARKLGVSLTRESVRKLIIEEAKLKKEELKRTLCGRFMFIKMDACTRHRVNYFAINVRFVDENNKMVTRTLGVKDTEARHTSGYLQRLVEQVFNDFNIKKQQILCIVTDNASNMLSTIEKMNTSTINEQILETEMADDFSASDLAQAEVDVEEQQDPEQNLEILDDIVEEASKLFLIQHMRCAVHTLQLAIRDGLKDHHAANLIGKLRQVAIAARTPKIDAILVRRAGKGAILDQVTRWGSTYMMIKRLLELKTFLEDTGNSNVSLNEIQWTQVKELEKLLSYPYNVTLKLQAEDLTPGAFLCEWRSLIYRLTQAGGVIADGIVSSMKKREGLLLDNKILLAAIYIDPMNRILLTNEQIENGKEALCQVAALMKGYHPENDPQDDQDEEIQENFSNSSSSNEEEIDFETYLDKMETSKEKGQKTKRPSIDIKAKKFKQEILNALKEVEKFGRKSKLTVHEAIPVYPEIIREVAMTVTAMPPTQVSVERLFSALKIIKSDLRASMKEDLAEAILFLRTSS